MFRGVRTTLAITSILLVLSAITAAQSLPISSSDKPVLSKAALAHLSEVSDFDQYVGYWTAESGWHTELQLRNNLDANDLIVTPALRAANGTETELPPVTIKSGEVTSLDLSDALLKSAPQLTGGWGSLVLRYRAVVYRALYAAVMVRAEGRPIAFHLDAFATRFPTRTAARCRPISPTAPTGCST